MTSTNDTRERAQSAASTAADEGKHVAETARDEARNVAGETAAQARNLVNETRGQITDQASQQARSQRDTLVSTLQTFSGDLDNMAAQGGSGLANTVVQELAERARALSRALDGREPQDMLEDVRGFARRRPGVFLVGALAAGMIAGRVARGAKQASAGSGEPGTGSASSPTYSPTVPPEPAVDAPGALGATGGIAGATAPHGQPVAEPTTSATRDPSDPLSTDEPGYGQRGRVGGEGSL